MNFASLTNHIPHRNPARYTKPYLQRDFYSPDILSSENKRLTNDKYTKGAVAIFATALFSIPVQDILCTPRVFLEMTYSIYFSESNRDTNKHFFSMCVPVFQNLSSKGHISGNIRLSIQNYPSASRHSIPSHHTLHS